MNETKNSYDSWLERVVVNRSNPSLQEGELVGAGKPEPYSPINFVKVEREKYTAEIGKRGKDYIYHFYPNPRDGEFRPDFEEKMGDAFLAIFKDANRVESAYTELESNPPLQSWAVKANGFVDNVWGDEQAVRVLVALDKLLE